MKGKKYTIYSIITALLEEVGLVAVVVWLLPKFGINIPFWGLMLMMAGLGAHECRTYRLCKEALDKKPIISPDIGSKGKAATALIPNGYIRINNELWKASSTGSVVDANEEVIIVGVDGMTLLITPEKDQLKIMNRTKQTDTGEERAEAFYQ